MKNKEIVKRLKDSLDYEFDLSFNDRKALLSYIEQLEEEIHKKEAMYDSLAVDYRLSQEQNEQLENNKDKAIKKLNKCRNRKDHYGLWCMEYIDNADVIHILKGDNNGN